MAQIAGARVQGAWAPPTHGFVLRGRARPDSLPPAPESRFPRSYADLLAEAGWIADTDYGFSGVERYLFAPGSPLVPSLSLDGFPVDLAGPSTTWFEGWGGAPAEPSWAFRGSALGAPGAMGSQSFVRTPVGEGQLLTHISLHGGDPGEQDALAQFAQEDGSGGWSAAAGIRKNDDAFLTSQMRVRGLSAEGARTASWGAWRAALLTSTSDLDVHNVDAQGFDSVGTVRRELLRLGLGASSRDSLLGASLVLARAGDGSSYSGREELAVRLAPKALPPGLAVVAALDARDDLPNAHLRLGVEAARPGWEAAAGVEAGTAPHGMFGRFSGRRALVGLLHVELEGSARAGAQTPAEGHDRLLELRVEPALSLEGGSARARLAAYMERDQGLEQEPPAAPYSVLQAAPVTLARSAGLQAWFEAPGPLSTRWGGMAFVQRTREEHGWRLPYQPAAGGNAWVEWNGRPPLLPMLAHARVVARGEGERMSPSGIVSGGHVTLDFEGVLDYESAHFQFGSYNFTNYYYDTTIRYPGADAPAPAFGRVVRFGVTWDLWD